MKSSIFKILFLIFLIIIFVFINAYSYSVAISDNLSDNFFRLHILANSDSKEDQNLKLLVRNEVLDFINDLTLNITSKEEAIELITNNLENIQTIAYETIIKNGYNYNISIEIGNFYFPTKYYGNIAMPEGFYDALRIKIGDAKGQNWWCSIYPALCFTNFSDGIIDEKAQYSLKNKLGNEEINLLFKSNQNNEIKLKFKIVELIEKLRK